jgi:hypothetical protein
MNAPPYSPGDPFRQLVVSVLEHLLFVQFLNSDQSEWVHLKKLVDELVNLI